MRALHRMVKRQSIEDKLDTLLTRVDNLETQNKELRIENRMLKNRLANYETPKNSKNSSKPPSSDFPKLPKTKSLRAKTRKKVGGQLGHKGTTLKMVEMPNIIEEHHSNYCTCCGIDLGAISGELVGKRQVIDIPPIEPIVTEHQIYRKQCTCGKVNQGNYPSDIKKSISYGSGIQALVGYMSARQFMPYERLKEFINTLFGLKISSGGINHLINKFAAKAQPFYEQIRTKVLSSTTIGADETGANIDGELHWAWTFQTPELTFLSVNKKRGYAAIEEIMPEGFRKSVLVTDCWKSYFMTDAKNHQLCTSHLLRELEFFIQKYPNNKWASNMKSLILEALTIHKEITIDKDKASQIFIRFNELLKVTIKEEMKEVVTFQKRMNKYANYLFNFLIHPDIPPDNNASERAVRNFKVKQKVSGFFKSIEGAKQYTVLRSIIDSAIKNAQNPFCVLRAIASA